MQRLYIYDDLEHFTDGDLAVACNRLSPERRRKAMSYVHATDRRQSAIAELLLRHALRDAYGLAHLPEIQQEANGKPKFSEAGLPGFNLSHCQLAVACAVADDAVGVDVEPYSSYGEDVAREVLSDQELSLALGHPDTFAELWTRKESWLKFTGEGLADNLKTLLPPRGAQFRTFHGAKGYACTVCAKHLNDEPPTFVDKTTLLNG